MDIWFVSFGACVWFFSTFIIGDVMNERIKELAEQCGVRFNNGGEYQMMWIEKFAELVRQDERQECFEFVYNYSDTYHHFGLCKRVAELMKDRDLT